MVFPGWPSCATEGCPWPALFKIRMENDAGPFWAHLCMLCVTQARECIATMSAVGESDRKLLEPPKPDDLEKTEILRIETPEQPS